MADAALSVRGVSIHFGGVNALEAVDADFPRGEIVGIIGPNGAGKTTLLNVICGMNQPDEGEVVLDGRNVTRMKPNQIAALGLLAALLTRRTGETGVRAIIRYCCQWVTEQPALAAFLLSREIKLSESAKRELKELDRAFGQALYDWFVPHVQKGELLELPRSLYIPIICGPTLEYSRLWLSGRNRRSPDDVSALLAEAAWQSIRGDLTP